MLTTITKSTQFLKSAQLGFYIMKLISNNKIGLHVWEVAALRKKL